MPNHKAHLFGGLLVFLLALFGCLATALLADPILFPSLLAICLLGALFPDIDTGSKIRHLWLVTTLIGACISWWFLPPVFSGLLLSLGVIPLFLPHRGITHRLWFLACISLIGGYCLVHLFPTQYYTIILHSAFFFAGASSHVFLDRLGSRFKRRYGRIHK